MEFFSFVLKGAWIRTVESIKSYNFTQISPLPLTFIWSFFLVDSTTAKLSSNPSKSRLFSLSAKFSILLFSASSTLGESRNFKFISSNSRFSLFSRTGLRQLGTGRLKLFLRNETTKMYNVPWCVVLFTLKAQPCLDLLIPLSFWACKCFSHIVESFL